MNLVSSILVRFVRWVRWVRGACACTAPTPPAEALGNAEANTLPACVTREGAVFRAGNAASLALDADGWLNVAWPGEFQHPEGFLQVVEPQDLQLALANFEAVRTEAGDNWAGLGLYVGHPEIDGTMASAPAMGWFKQARIANGALQYRLEANADGQAAIGGRKYKFISPYWYGSLDNANRFHPFYISTVGLTNSPVVKPAQGNKPLANADGQTTVALPQGDPAGAVPAPAPGTDAVTAPATAAETAVSTAAAAAQNAVSTGAAPVVTAVSSAVGSGEQDRSPAGPPGAEPRLAALAAALNVAPGEGGQIDHDALLAAAHAAGRAVVAESALRAEFAAFVVDQAIARESVAPSARANALSLANADRAAAIGLWFGTRSATRSAAATSPAPSAAAPNGRRAPLPPAVARAAANAAQQAAAVAAAGTPPADPLQGKQLANAAASGSLPVRDGAPERVLAAAKAHMASEKCTWSDANTWAWNQERMGCL